MTIHNISKFKNLLTNSAAACLLILPLSTQIASSNSVELFVEATKTGTLSGGDLNLPAGSFLQKIGDGTLCLSGDHTGTNHLKGQINVKDGILQIDHAKSLGDASKILFYDASTFQANADDIAPSNTLKFKNDTVATSFNIDCNNHAITLPAINADSPNLGRAELMTVHFKNNAVNATVTYITLSANYVKSTNNDIMVIHDNVNLVSSSNSKLAKKMHMTNNSSFTAGTGFTFTPPITFLNSTGACSAIIDCHDHDFTSTGVFSTETNNHPVTLTFRNTLDTDDPNFLTLSANYNKGTADDVMVIDSNLTVVVGARAQLADNLQMNMASKLKATGSFVLPKLVAQFVG